MEVTGVAADACLFRDVLQGVLQRAKSNRSGAAIIDQSTHLLRQGSLH
jgi:hypothetical protein